MNNKVKDRLATAGFWAGAGLVICILGGLLGYILYHGAGALDWHFITAPPETFRSGGGVGPQLFNSFYMLVLTMLFTVPIGLLAGIYMAEYSRPGKITETIRLSIEALTSLPSIVVGLFGLLIFVNMTGWGYTLLSGALALTVINLPLVVRISEEALRSVPHELREASLALGADRWQTICFVILPSALPGLITGIIIAAGRVFGEAAALLFTAGMSSPALDWSQWWNLSHPGSPLNPFRPAETLAVHIWKVNSEALIPDIRRVADGSAALLVCAVVTFNIAARALARAVSRRLQGT